jgi:hypothetical protein
MKEGGAVKSITGINPKIIKGEENKCATSNLDANVSQCICSEWLSWKLSESVRRSRRRSRKLRAS